MRKVLVFTFVLAFLFSIDTNAQIGVKLGANFAGLNSSTETEGSAMRIGLNGGVIYEVGILPLGLLKLHTELLYSQQGFTVNNETKGTGTTTVVDYKVSLDYIKLPIMARVKLGPLFVAAGPYFGYAINGTNVGSVKTTLDASGDALPAPYSYDIDVDLYDKDTYMKKFDMGVDLGLGMQFGIPMVPLKFFVEGRAAIGLTNIYDTESENFKSSGMKDTDYIKNLVIGVSLGVLFGK